MPKPQQWPRDVKGKPASFLRSRETADVFSFLEALGKGEVVISPQGRGTGKIIATLKKWVLHLSFTSKAAANPYPMDSTAGGSTSGGGSADPPVGSAPFEDQYDGLNPPLDITDDPTDGVRLSVWQIYYTGAAPVARVLEVSGGGTTTLTLTQLVAVRRTLTIARDGTVRVSTQSEQRTISAAEWS
jgi:hypothetical protein